MATKKTNRHATLGTDQTNSWRYKPRSCTGRDRTTDRVSINVSRDELDLVVDALRTAVAFHFNTSLSADTPADELSAAYARDRHDRCVTMLNWIQPIHDEVAEHATLQ